MTRQLEANTTERSEQCYERARKVLVGGVNSPVRAFRAVGGKPVFLHAAEGPYVIDVDGNRYVDLVGSWGPAIVGHAHPQVVKAVQQAAAEGLSFGACCEREAELAEIIVGALPTIDLVRFVNSGTEATMSAVRLARAATGRTKILKFLGCYHGHVDSLLVAAGSGAATLGTPDSAGVPAETAAQTLLAPYNDLDAVNRIMTEQGSDIAAILVEPVAGNMGFVPPAGGFLEGLRAACDKAGSLLVFDEVMTGFRVAWGGYQVRTGVRPDLTCLGKVIGGGMPVAAYGGRRELMEQVSPLGPMYQAGTLSGNPLGMASGAATLSLCREPGFYETLGAKAKTLTEGVRDAAQAAGVPIQTGAMGGMMGVAFSDRPVRNYDDAAACDHGTFGRFFHAMLQRGVWLPPSSYEAMFISSAHDDQALATVVEAAAAAFKAAPGMTLLRVGTRGSRLALTQTRWVCGKLREQSPALTIEEVVIKTHGDLERDRPFDADWPVGSFVTALESELLAEEIDVAVHSYKDLPSLSPAGLVIAAVPPREVVHDLLVTRGPIDLYHLPAGFRVGTSSPRRTAQVRRLGDVEILPLRGNVPTRLEKLERGDYDGIVCAAAGLRRLGLEPVHALELSPQRFVPAPAQGALAIQTRSGDDAATIVGGLEDAETRVAVDAERTFLARIEAGCQTPVGAWASVDAGTITLRAQLFSADGTEMVEGIETGDDPAAIGGRLAERLLADLGS